MEYNKLLPNIRQPIEIGMILAKRLLENLHRDKAPCCEFEACCEPFHDVVCMSAVALTDKE